MANCEWCGRYYPDGEGYRGGPRWNRHYYCSKRTLWKKSLRSWFFEGIIKPSETRTKAWGADFFVLLQQ